MRVDFESGNDVIIRRDDGAYIGKVVANDIFSESAYGQSWTDGTFFVVYKSDPDGIMKRRFGPVPTMSWALRDMRDWYELVNRESL